MTNPKQGSGADSGQPFEIYTDPPPSDTPTPSVQPHKHDTRSVTKARIENNPLNNIPSPTRLRPKRTTRGKKAKTALQDQGAGTPSIPSAIESSNSKSKGKLTSSMTTRTQSKVAGQSLERDPLTSLQTTGETVQSEVKDLTTQLRKTSLLSNPPKVPGEESSSSGDGDGDGGDKLPDSDQENSDPAKENLHRLILQLSQKLPSENKTLGNIEQSDIVELQNQVDKWKREHNFAAVYVLEKMLKVIKTSQKLIESMNEYEKIVHAMGLEWEDSDM
ncbi:hypothetical protein K491DRAFT_679933 [Lophiostoma macrostomum CBS 122681]|uniref:Uncharacterized protein n=1 Tax=Lophiostoma macrostomum CBS 122681 TaxID=1314788 RepID=A0A6A6T4A0_9PLEO|nr:hypothetical protein K491DRAFT_679933 [Lophiostoma macrostomum CBS 122681]